MGNAVHSPNSWPLAFKSIENSRNFHTFFVDADCLVNFWPSLWNRKPLLFHIVWIILIFYLGMWHPLTLDIHELLGHMVQSLNHCWVQCMRKKSLLKTSRHRCRFFQWSSHLSGYSQVPIWPSATTSGISANVSFISLPKRRLFKWSPFNEYCRFIDAKYIWRNHEYILNALDLDVGLIVQFTCLHFLHQNFNCRHYGRSTRRDYILNLLW